MVNIAEEYLETRVMTAPPAELHLMVVDGALRQTQRAHEALQRKDSETAHFALNQARDFVVELISGLNEEHAEELVTRLKGLFGFVYRRLNEADLYHDAEKTADALLVLQKHRETWQALMEKLRESSPSADDEAHFTEEEASARQHRPTTDHSA